MTKSAINSISSLSLILTAPFFVLIHSALVQSMPKYLPFIFHTMTTLLPLSFSPSLPIWFLSLSSCPSLASPYRRCLNVSLLVRLPLTFPFLSPLSPFHAEKEIGEEETWRRSVERRKRKKNGKKGLDFCLALILDEGFGYGFSFVFENFKIRICVSIRVWIFGFH